MSMCLCVRAHDHFTEQCTVKLFINGEGYLVFLANTSWVAAIDTAKKQSDCQGQVYSSQLTLSVPCLPHNKNT